MNTSTVVSFPDPPDFDSIREALSPLLNTVREAIAEGCLHVLEYASWQAEAIDFALAPNLVRHKAKQLLIAHGQEAEDEKEERPGFEAEHISNNGLCLVAPGFKIRILKSAEDGGIPQPGNSLTRRNFYNQHQALLDFEEFRNGHSRVQPTWGLIVHWTVDRNYSLLRLSIALPLNAITDENGKLTVECSFDEPIWTRPERNAVAEITEVVAPRDLDLPIEEESDEKTGAGSKEE